MRVAIVHYWLVGIRGGEKVVSALLEAYPGADIITHVFDPVRCGDLVRGSRVKTTFIAKLPFARRLYKLYLPLMPLALEQMSLSEYDLIISSESGPAKGVLLGRNSLHVCYCHTPMRYCWDMQADYISLVPWGLRWLARIVLHYLRIWDASTEKRVDLFIANSRNVASRITRVYRRNSVVVYPPVHLADFAAADCARSAKSDYYLIVGELVPYKRADLAIDACARIGRRLVVVGSGSEEASLKRRSKGCNVEFRGRVSDGELSALYHGAKALLFPGEEDFGIVPVEAIAFGVPVIAYAYGGATETVIEGKTGILFGEQSSYALAEAINRFEKIDIGQFDINEMRKFARKFSKDRFVSEVSTVINDFIRSRHSL